MQQDLSASARATAAAEARFRVNYTNSKPRKSCIIAFDDSSMQAMKGLAADRSGEAHFLRYIESKGVTEAFEILPVDAILEDLDRRQVNLSDEIADADIVVMVTTARYCGDAAEVIGNACFVRNKMTTGLVLTSLGDSSSDCASTSAMMRPFASMLVISGGEEYVGEMLNALRV
jgi:hypothetical protein